MPTVTTGTCWIAGTILGALVWLFASGSAGWFGGLFLALIAAVLLARFLIWMSCDGYPAMDGGNWQPDPVAVPVPAPRPEPVANVMDARTVSAQAMPAGPDDLTRIKGVGPKMDEVLHVHGVTSFAQIAAWDEAEIDRFAVIIGRMGSRIRSDDWVGQAKLLAGGEG